MRVCVCVCVLCVCVCVCVGGGGGGGGEQGMTGGTSLHAVCRTPALIGQTTLLSRF